MVAEYLIKAGLDTSGLAADLKKIDHFFDPRTLMLRVDYNNSDVKAVQNMIDNIADNDYTVAIKMEYDLNKSILDAQLRKLSDMQEFTISGKLDKTLVNELNKVNEQFEGDIDLKKFDYIEDGLNRIRAIINTIDEVGGNVGNDLRKSVVDAVEAVEDVYGRKLKDVGSIFTKEDIINQQSVVAYYQDIVSTIDDALKRAQDETAGHNLIIDNLEIDSSAVQGAIDKASKGVKVTVDKVDFDFKDLDPDTQNKLNEYFSTKLEAAHAYQSRLDENAANEKRISQLIEENEQLSKENQQLQEEMAKINSSATGLVGSGSGDGVGSTSDDEVATLEERLQKRSEYLKRAIEIAKEAKQKSSELQKELESTKENLQEETHKRHWAEDSADQAWDENYDLKSSLEKKIEEIKEIESLKDDLEQRIKSLEEDNELLSGDRDFYHGEVDGLIEQNVSLDSELSKLREQYLEVCRDFNSLEDVKKELEDSLAKLQSEDNVPRSEHSELQKNYNDLWDRYIGLGDELDGAKNAIEKAKQEAAELREAQRELEDELQVTKDNNDFYKQSIKSWEHYGETTKKNINSYKRRIESLLKTSDELKESKKKIEELEKNKSELDKQIEELNSSNSIKQGKINENEELINNLKIQSSELEEQINKAKSDYESAIAEIKELTSIKDELLQQLEDVSRNASGNIGGFGNIELSTESIQKFMQSIEELVSVLGELRTALASIGDMKIDFNFKTNLSAQSYKNAYENNSVFALSQLEPLYSNLRQKLDKEIREGGWAEHTIEGALMKIAGREYNYDFSKRGFQAIYGGNTGVGSVTEQINDYAMAFNALKEIARGIDFKDMSFFDEFDRIMRDYRDVGKVTSDGFQSVFGNLFKGADLSIVNASIANMEESLKNLKINIGQIEFPEDTSALTAEQSALRSLVDAIDMVINAIDQKNAAFQAEGQIVDGVINGESSNLTALTGWITMAGEQVEKLQNAFKEIGNFKFDTNFYQQFTDSLNVDKINQDLTELLESFMAFTDLTNGLKLDGTSFLADINSILSKSSDLRNLVDVFKYLENQGMSIKEAAKKFSAETGTIKPQKSVKSQVSSLSKYIDSIDLGDERYTKAYLDRLKAFRAEAANLLKSGVDTKDQDSLDNLHRLMDEMKELKQDAKKAENKVLTDTARSGFDNQLASYQKNLRSTSEYIEQIEDIRERLKTATTMQEKNSLQNEFNQIKTAAQKAGDVGVDTADKLKKALSEASNTLSSVDTVGTTDEFLRRVEYAKKELNSLVGSDFSAQEDVDRLKHLSSVIDKISTDASRNKIVDTDAVVKMADDMDEYKNSLRSTSPYIKEISDLQDRLFNAQSEGDRLDVEDRFKQLKVEAKAAGDVGNNTMKDLEDRFSGLVKEIGSIDTSKFTDNLRNDFNGIKSTVDSITANGGLDFTKEIDVKRLDGLISRLNEIKTKSQQDEFKLVDQDSLLSMTSDINKFYDSLSPSSTFRGELDALREMISDIVTEADRLEAKKIFDNIKLKANASGDTTKTAERSYLERQAKSEIESLYKMESQTRSLSNAISELQAEVKAEGGLDMITNADDEKLTSFIDKIKTLKKEVSQDTSARTGRNGVETRLDRLMTQADNFDLSQIYNVEGINTTFNKAVSDLERLSSMRFTLSVGDIDTELSGIEARLKSVYEAANRLSKIDLAIEGLQNLDISKLSPKGKDEVEELINKLQKLRSDAKSGAIDITVDTSQVKEAMSQVDEFLASKKKAEYQAANESNISALDANMASFASRLKSTSQYIGAIDELRASLKEVSSGGDFKAIADGFNQIKSAAIDAGDVGKSVMQHLGNRIKQMSINAVAMYLSFYDIIRYARQAFGVIKEYDTALTEMRKVSDYSVDTLKEYQASTFDTAGALGTTALQIQNSTADFMRLGESIDEAKKSAEAANLMMNVSEFDNISEATDSLISMSAAYSNVEKMDIVDKMNEIGNNYAISTDGVATALQNSAASLVTAGNDIDEAVALVTAGNVITQDPNKVGSGIRTIALRLTGTKEAKAELEEMGEETEDVITTQSKLRDTIMSATKVASNGFKGFDILDDNGNYKSTYEIMLGIADIYDEIAATDKKFGSNNLNLLLETMAGKNRSNIAASILQNGEILKKAYMSSMNADGSAMKENEKYLDSLEGKIQQFTNAAHEALNSAISSDWLKDLVDLGTTLLNIVNDIIQAVDQIPGGIFSVLGGLGLIGGKAFSSKHNLKIGGITDLISGLFGIDNIGLKVGEELGSDIAKSTGDAITKNSPKVIDFPKSLIKNTVKNTTNELSKQTSKLPGGGLLGALLSTPAGIGLAALGVGVVGASIWKQAKINRNREIFKSGDSANRQWQEESKSLGEQIQRYEQLSKEITSGDYSDSEILEKKKEIFGIQQQIIGTYGQQAEGINLVNGELRNQISLLENIGIQNAKNNRDAHFDEYNAIKKSMTGDFSDTMEFEYDREYLSEQLPEEVVKRIQDQKIPNLEIVPGPDGIGLNLKVSGDVFQQIEAAQEYMELLNDLEVEHRLANPDQPYDLAPFKSEASAYLKIAQDFKEAREEVYNSILSQDIAAAGGGEKLNAYTDAIERYNEALTFGNSQEVSAARKNVQETSDAYLEWFNENSAAYGLSSRPYEAASKKIDEIQETNRDFEELLSLFSDESNYSNDEISKLLSSNGNKLWDDVDAISDYISMLKQFDLTSEDIESLLTLSTSGDTSFARNALYGLAKILGLVGENGELSSQAVELLNSNLSDSEIVAKSASEQMDNTVESYSDFYATARKEIDRVDSLNSLLVKSISGEGLTMGNYDAATGKWDGDVQAIIDAFDTSKVKGFSLDGVLKRTSTGIKINQKAWRNLQAQQERITKQGFLERQADLTDRLTEAQNALAEANAANDLGAANAAQAKVDALSAQLANVKLLASEYDGATSAYQKWLDAQSAGEEGDLYDTIRDTALKRADELYEAGLVGTNEFRAIANLFSNEDLSTAPLDRVIEAYQGIDKVIGNTGVTMRQLFTEDGQGAVKFSEALVDLGLATGSATEGFTYATKSYAEFAQALGISEDLVSFIFGKIRDYGGDYTILNDGEVDKLKEMNAEMAVAQQNLKDLNANGKATNNGSVADFSALDFNLDELSTVDDLIAKKGELEDLKINASPEAVEYLDQILEQIQTKIDILNGEYIGPEVNSFEAVQRGEEALTAMQTRMQEISEWNKNHEGYQISIEGDAELRSYADFLAKLPPELLTELKFEVPEDGQLTADDIITQLQNRLDSEKLDVKPDFDVQGAIDDITGNKYQLDAELNLQNVEEQTTIDPPQLTGTMTINEEIGEEVEATEKEPGVIPYNEEITSEVQATDKEGGTITYQEKIQSAGVETGKKASIVFDESVGKQVNPEDKHANIIYDESEGDLDKEATVTYHTDTSEPDGYQPDQKDGNVVFKKDSSIPDAYQPSNKSATVKYSADLSGLPIALSPITRTVNYIASGPMPAFEGTAHASGTANAHGDWGAKKSEEALVNELGPEIIVRDNKWFTANGGKPGFTHIKKGDIVFNHKQSEELMKNGYVSSGHAKLALAQGTAYAGGGTGAWSANYINQSYKNNVSSTPTYSNQAASNAASVAKSSASTAKSTGKSAKNSKDFKETLDEIEILLDRVDRQIEHIDKTAQAAYRTFSDRNTAFIDEINLIDEQIQHQLDGYQRYMKEANSVGLAEEWAKKVREGQIDIEKVTNEDLWNKIEDYRNWYISCHLTRQRVMTILLNCWDPLRATALQRSDEICAGVIG